MASSDQFKFETKGVITFQGTDITVTVPAGMVVTMAESSASTEPTVPSPQSPPAEPTPTAPPPSTSTEIYGVLHRMPLDGSGQPRSMTRAELLGMGFVTGDSYFDEIAQPARPGAKGNKWAVTKGASAGGANWGQPKFQI